MTSTDRSEGSTALIDRTIDTAVPEPFGAYLFLDGDPAAEIARSLERAVFLEAFGNTPELLATEYGQYESASLFVCVVDHRARRAAGAMRLIVPRGGAGLKSLNDVRETWGEPPELLLDRLGIIAPPSAFWDIATLVVAPEYRSAAATGLVSLGLYQSVVRTACAAGVEWLCAILDLAVYRMTKLKFAAPFEPFGEPKAYLGSAASVPVTCYLPSWRSRLGERDPAIAEIIYDGVGIEAALRPVELGVAAALTERLLGASADGRLSRRSRAAMPSRGESRAVRGR